jgi:hypothetical protein
MSADEVETRSEVPRIIIQDTEHHLNPMAELELGGGSSAGNAHSQWEQQKSKLNGSLTWVKIDIADKYMQRPSSGNASSSRQRRLRLISTEAVQNGHAQNG